MRKFTDTEIDLCKKIAEKERREIDYGDWFVWKNDPTAEQYLWKHSYNPKDSKEDDDMVSLWAEHDCLEWLKEKGWLLSRFNEGRKEPKVLCMFWKPRKSKFALSPDYNGGCGDTPLEALLCAVLAVMR